MQVNEYFDGNVRSIGFENDEGRVTAGVMNPGEYTFNTSEDERIVVTCGSMNVRRPDAEEFETFVAGDEFFVPAGNAFDLKIDSPVAYLCFYG